MRSLILSNCCGAKMHHTFCTECGEHAAPEDEPSIELGDNLLDAKAHGVIVSQPLNLT